MDKSPKDKSGRHKSTVVVRLPNRSSTEFLVPSSSVVFLACSSSSKRLVCSFCGSQFA